MRLVALITLTILAAPTTHRADEPADARVLWAYEGGWLARQKDGSWLEMNEEAYRKNGKGWKFRESARTKGHIELHDEARKVSVRLSTAVMMARWDSDGKGGEWKPLNRGRWKKPVP